MTDQEIIGLYWDRDEQALSQTERTYGGYCRSIAWNILKNRQDTEECVNDTWLRAWNAMPPQKPAILSVFLGTITRNLSLDRWRNATAKKRGAGCPLLRSNQKHTAACLLRRGLGPQYPLHGLRYLAAVECSPSQK